MPGNRFPAVPDDADTSPAAGIGFGGACVSFDSSPQTPLPERAVRR